MNKVEKDIKNMTLDLSKLLSYLTELSKTHNQIYVTKEGMALLEGAVIGGNSKIKVVPRENYDLLISYHYDEMKKIQNKPKKKSMWRNFF